jgi:membrane-associated phospholipid phosphatase
VKDLHRLHGTIQNRTISRRGAIAGLGSSVVAMTLAVSTHGIAGADHRDVDARQIEPNAGAWKTWILKSGNQLDPGPPPADGATRAELADLRGMVATDDAASLDRITFWDAGAPGYRWNEMALQLTRAAGQGPGDAYRAMALLNVAIYDATIATWAAKYRYNRPRPANMDTSLATRIPTPASPSYPSAHAATAGAAWSVLAYLFPTETVKLSRLAGEAMRSRVDAGVEFPSDGIAGLKIGQRVGELVIQHAKADGSDAEKTFDPKSLPTGPGLWTGMPVYPTLGAWKTWVLPDGAAMRPPAPPAWNSPQRAAEIAEIRNYRRDAYPFTELFFWPDDPAGRPKPDSGPFSSNEVVFYYAPVLHFIWGPELSRKIAEERLDTNPPRAARAYALVSVACFDATVACWEAKFHYMVARPNQFDSTITTVLPTYPIPDYPSGHAATEGGTAQVLSYLFPRDEHFFQSRAEELAASRVWAGIHFRSAVNEGLKQGRAVGQAVIDWAQNDGADGTDDQSWRMNRRAPTYR